MTRKCAVFVAILLAGMGLAHEGAARADGLDIIAFRQVGMALQAGDFAFIRSVVAAKGDVKPLEDPAKAIARWAKIIPVVFPPGSDKGDDTKALPQIWSDRAGFEKNAMTVNEVATKLAVAAKAGDADEVAVQTKALGEACGGCHHDYRAK